MNITPIIALNYLKCILQIKKIYFLDFLSDSIDMFTKNIF